MASNWNLSSSGAFGFPKLAVISEKQPMTWVPPSSFEFLGVFCEHFQVCSDLPLVTAPYVQSWFEECTVLYSKSTLYCSPLKWIGSRLFSSLVFHVPAGSSPGKPGVVNFRNLPPSLKHATIKIVHQLWRTKIPLATIFGCISLIPLAFFSRSQERPVSIVYFWGVLFDLPSSNRTRIFISSLFWISVVENGHEDYSITEIFRWDVLSLQICLNFVEKVQCCGSC